MAVLLIAVVGPFTAWTGALAIGPADTEAELEACLTLLGGGLTLAFMGLCCLVPVVLAVPVISGLMLKHSLSAERRGP